MDKKTIALIGLTVLALIFWNQIATELGLIKKTVPVAVVAPLVTDTTVTVTREQQPMADTSRSAAVLSVPIDSTVPERKFRVTTPNYELIFSNYGGGIKKIVLLNYRYDDTGHVVLIESVNQVVPDFESVDGTFKSSRLVFACDQRDFILPRGSSSQKVVFTYDNGRGGRMVKTYTIAPDRYDIGFDVAVEGMESFGFERSYHLVWGVPLRASEKNLKADYGYFKAVALMDNYKEMDKFKGGILSEEIPGSTTWAGLRTKYFTSLMICRTRLADGVMATGTSREVRLDDKTITERILAATLDIPLSASQDTLKDSYTLYAGPIDYKILKGYGLQMEELTSLGWKIIKPFSIAIIWLLPKIYSVIPNYGVVILIFSLLVKVIVYPLTRKQNMAMAKMKDLQPKMKTVQEKYKQDPVRMNKELMKLYKEAGANPLSGCLPMLPQLPLFFALYRVFGNTIEFRGAYFVGWISDLSAPDRLFILPLVMVVVMFIQQKITMTDPKQKMMVYLFPLFFGYISINFPAGLTLYWTAFSLLSLLEIVFIRRQQTPAVTVVEEKK